VCVCCSVLQCVAVCCNVLLRNCRYPVCTCEWVGSWMICVCVCCSVLQCVAVCGGVLQRVAAIVLTLYACVSG